MSTFNRPNPPTEPRRPWVSPVLKVVGTIADVLQGGGGKLSAARWRLEMVASHPGL